MLTFLAGVAVGCLLGGWVGANWRYWLDEGIDWVVSISAVVGVVAIIGGAIALYNGWRPM